jgi:hypothetical protein
MIVFRHKSGETAINPATVAFVSIYNSRPTIVYMSYTGGIPEDYQYEFGTSEEARDLYALIANHD